jgi:hypothetical protein
VKVKTSALTGIALDYAVAKAQGGTNLASDGITWGFELEGELKVLAKGWAPSMSYCPSTNWAQGGPIIERKKITVSWLIPAHQHQNLAGCWSAHIPGGNGKLLYGLTPLTAAMRCYVASELGDEVDIPEELLV